MQLAFARNGPRRLAALACNSRKYEAGWLAAGTRLHFDGLLREASVEVFFSPLRAGFIFLRGGAFAQTAVGRPGPANKKGEPADGSAFLKHAQCKR
jgi:hypothetical protein